MSNTKNQSFSLLSLFKFALGWPISLVALFFIAKIIISNGKSLLPNLNNINIPLLLLGILFFILYYFVRSYVWKIILKLQGYDIPFKEVSFLWELSELKRFAPGKIWSLIGRSSVFGKHNIPQKTILKSILIEIQLLLLANTIVSVLALPFISKYIITFPLGHLMTSAIILLITLATMFFIFSGVFSSPSLSPKGRGNSFSPLSLRESVGVRVSSLFPPYSAKTKFSMLLISCFYALSFGLGTYFTAISIVYLEAQLFLQIVGFFVFSFLVSYLSFITPMGIGVREGVMTIGLAKIIPLATSGVVSIFVRIVLILSELCFLCFTYFWKSAKNKYILFLEDFALRYKQEVVLFLLIIAYIIYFTFASFLRYDNFYTGRFDLGNMDQTVWNTIHGRIFEITDPNGTETVSRLAFHADFILILLSPLYLIWEHPKMLLLTQSVVLGMGAYFLYLIGKKVIKNKTLSLVIATCFLLNPAVQFTNLYDFHAVTLSTTFLLGTFYFLLKKKYLLFLLFAALATLTKEQVWVIIALFGLYISFFKPADHYTEEPSPHPLSLRERARVRGRKILGLIIILVSVLIFYFLIWHAIPNARGGQHFALSYYSDFGDSPMDVIKSVFFSPQKTLLTFFQKDQLSYLTQLFLPLGFLSLLSPLHLIFALPDLFINLLSSNPKLHQIYYQYSAAITPFIFISAIFGVRNLKAWFPKLPYIFFIFYFLFFIFYSAYSYGPLPLSKKPNIDMFTKPQKNKIEIDNFLSPIPDHYSIAASNNIGSHLSQREKIFTVPNGIDKADIVIFLANDQKTVQTFENQIKAINSNKNYKQILKIEEIFIAFERQAAP